MPTKKNGTKSHKSATSAPKLMTLENFDLENLSELFDAKNLQYIIWEFTGKKTPKKDSQMK